MFALLLFFRLFQAVLIVLLGSLKLILTLKEMSLKQLLDLKTTTVSKKISRSTDFSTFRRILPLTKLQLTNSSNKSWLSYLRGNPIRSAFQLQNDFYLQQNFIRRILPISTIPNFSQLFEFKISLSERFALHAYVRRLPLCVVLAYGRNATKQQRKREEKGVKRKKERKKRTNRLRKAT